MCVCVSMIKRISDRNDLKLGAVAVQSSTLRRKGSKCQWSEVQAHHFELVAPVAPAEHKSSRVFEMLIALHCICICCCVI